MTKQEQIKEMAKIVDEMYNIYTTTADDIAEGLYNAGYRKVLLDTETGKSVDCVQYAPWQLIEGYTEREVEKVRKETTKDIINKIIYYTRINTKAIDGVINKKSFMECVEVLAKQYGVEVEE